MSILTNPPADYVEIEGMRYKVHTDFRNWIRIGSILSCSEQDMKIRLIEAFKLCYLPGSLPPSLEGASYAMLRFYAGAEEQRPEAHGREPESRRPIYDFEYDAEYIVAAFWGQYNIDLTQAQLHWHIFKALFAGLCENNKICKIMEYRSVDVSKIKDKEQKRFYRKMQRLYRLPDMRSQEEKEADMMRTLAEAF